jgi:cell division protein FtsL|nr:MAG TPA: hypothetical protein [Caudoviricetes sp.]
MKEKQMRIFLHYLCIAAALTLIGYTFYVERQVVAATERVNATTSELRIKAELEGENK